MSTASPSDQDAATKPSPRRFIPLVLLLAAVVGWLGYRAYLARKPYEWSGTVEARVITVGSRVGGRIKEVLVHEGDPVQAGQVLITLEPGDLEAQRLSAAGQLAQAEAALERVKAGARPEEIEQAKARAATAAAALQESRAGARGEQIAAAEARLVAAQASVDKAKLDAERTKTLVASGAISQAEADNADVALRAAVASRDAQKHTVDELKNGTRREDVAQAAARAKEAAASARLVEAGSRVEDIRAAEGALMAAQGKLKSIEVLIEELSIKAPRAATVEALDLRPGDILGPNAAAVTLLEDDQLYVRIYVPETKIGLIKVGDPVPITVDSFPGKSFGGVVEHINTVGEYSPRNLQTADERADQVFATRIGLREGKKELRAGMAAFITVPK
ncbi:MAG: efflux RND transporter periplasmic adaptor subunit [Byssovorax sp.]